MCGDWEQATELVFVASADGGGVAAESILVLDALHKLGAVAVAAVVAAGFVLTSTLLPGREPAARVAPPSMAAPPIIAAPTPTPSPSPTRDSVRAVVGPAVDARGLHVLAGEPALTGKQVEKVATDERLFDAVASERCGDVCPAFAVPVP